MLIFWNGYELLSKIDFYFRFFFLDMKFDKGVIF